jgi:hypothetical protein
MNGTEETNCPQRGTRYVLFGQIAIVELTQCRPSASVQADSKATTAKISRSNHKYGKRRDTPEDHSPMGIASDGQAAHSRAGSGVCEEGDRAERTSAQPA